MNTNHVSDCAQVLTHALEAYKTDKDLNRIIGIYENVLFAQCPELKSTEHGIRLVDFYGKASERDKAWGLLNEMILLCGKNQNNVRHWKIKDKMFRICKKEGRIYDAIYHLMESRIYKHRPSGAFDRDSFEKEVRPLLRKIGRQGVGAENELSKMASEIKQTANQNWGTFVLYDTDKLLKGFRDYSARYLE